MITGKIASGWFLMMMQKLVIWKKLFGYGKHVLIFVCGFAGLEIEIGVNIVTFLNALTLDL